MSGIRVEGNTSGNVAEVDTNNNLKTNLPQLVAQAGFGLVAGQIGDGTYTSSVYRRAVRVSDGDRLQVGLDTPLFDYNFTATSQDTGVWKYTVSLLAATQSGGFLNVNSGSVGTTNGYASMQTWHYFTSRMNGGIRVSTWGNFNLAIPANETTEFGVLLASGIATPGDGVYFRITSAGISGVLNYGGGETVTLFASSAFSAFVGTTVIEYTFNIYPNAVAFFADDNYLGEIPIPNGNATAFESVALPYTVQRRNLGTVSSPTIFKVGHVRVDQIDVDINVPFPVQQVTQGLMCSQGTQGNTMGTTGLLTNSKALAGGTAMTNTAVGPGTGLGGQFTVLPTLAAGTDGILCSYQVPVGSTAIPAKKLVITGIRFQGMVSVVFVGGPVWYIYSLAYGHTAVSLGTAESGSFSSGTTKAPRRVALGIDAFAATAPVATFGQIQQFTFNSPICVNPGEFIALVAKNVNTVTSSGAIVYTVTFDGFWM